MIYFELKTASVHIICEETENVFKMFAMANRK